MGMWTIPEKGDTGRFTPEEVDAFVQRIAQGIARRGLVVPAVLFLELSRPLSFVGAAALTVAAPLAEVLVSPTDVELMTVLLEDRNRVEQLLCAIEMAAESAGKPATDASLPLPPPGNTPTDKVTRNEEA